MSRTEIPTVTCPNCKQSLPAWSQTCQFCGSPLKGVVRPMGAPIVDTWTDRPTWQEVCYIVVSVAFILNGGYELLQGFKVLPNPLGELSFAGYLAYLQIMGFASAILGVGMLFQQLWAQFLVKWYSVLVLVFELWSLMTSLMGASIASRVVGSGVVTLRILEHVAYAAFYGFTIYIIKVVGDVDP
ncbi:MAG TPA: zinc ribbon domain-containing protein [Fimbriimonadaceae bacterium]|nr:zinc ribbon domain-containing protein [Fimbriimonadaceae bacterium]